jgi:hypothetical protein
MAKAGRSGIRGRIDSAKKRVKGLEAKKLQIDKEIDVLDKYIAACQFIQETERGGSRRMAARKAAKSSRARVAKPLQAPGKAGSGARFKGMKIAEGVEILLKRSGVPLKVSEMVKRLRAGGIKISSKVPGASVTAALRRHPGKFKMTKPGFYIYIEK